MTSARSTGRRWQRTLAALLCATTSLGVACGSGSSASDADEDRTRHLVIFVYDRSGSILDYQLELAADLTAARVRELEYGDAIVAMELLEASLDEPPQRWSQTVPEREYADLEVQSDEVSRARFLRDTVNYLETFTDTEERVDTRGTDILSTLHDVASDLQARPDHEATLYLFSDMLQANAAVTFEGAGNDPPSGWVDRAAADGRLPDLGGLCVVVVGARTESSKGQAVKDFWMEYFAATGARLLERNYTLRPVTLPTAPCGR